MINLTGQVAVVTGGSRGIGKEIAKTSIFGADVVINYTSKEDEALKTKNEIESMG